MQNANIYRRRITQFIDRIYAQRYSHPQPLTTSYIYNQNKPIPFSEVHSKKFKPIKVGAQWGKIWGSAWFKVEGTVPKSHAGNEVYALVDIDGEACVFLNGVPHRGLTHKSTKEGPHLKRRIPVGNPAKEGQSVSILIEGAANGLFGKQHNDTFYLKQAELAIFHRDIWDLSIDCQILIELAAALHEDSPRAKKIIFELNKVANTWNDGENIAACRKITKDLLSLRANVSDCTIWSIGHAHIDLGWHWPVRETKRKGARTFSTALRMLEEYPEYKFGASQPQLYEWMKDEYPELYSQIKAAVRQGRWELQGAMWVEPDMNITGGESLIRQCLYGKRFYQTEFGQDVRNLWLPDVFGYSAALPQILKKAGVDVFMTQKISWNETNVFPHHTFLWEGIDGTKIMTHFLPTNNYNVTNQPKQLIDAQKRFAQIDIQDDFLNLFGIGDGGGGPSRSHIERGIRLQNTEGSPKVKFAFADAFFKKIAKTKHKDLPLWCGELYLELHRGTLTTQGRMKRYNRLLEQKLHDVEFFASLTDSWPKDELDGVWKDTLLNQFHDILPGSSIAWVYRDAHAVSEKNLRVLANVEERALRAIFGKSENAAAFVVLNSMSWDRQSVITLPAPSNHNYRVMDALGNELESVRRKGDIDAVTNLPSLGYTTVRLEKGDSSSVANGVTCTKNGLENAFVRIKLATDGTISSIFDKTAKKELIRESANKLLLWEDLPYSWDAWDVSHYYRETTPRQAALASRSVVESSPIRGVVEQTLTVGTSTIEQRIILEKHSPLIKIENQAEWKESNKLLKVHADTTVHSRHATFEIQFGQLERTTHENTSWDQAQFEVSGQRYADLSQEDYGIALLNDCKYGYSVYHNSIELSLLRSPKHPDPEADMGAHQFTYAYLPHSGSIAHSHVFRAAHELNSPVSVRGVGRPPTRLERSWFRIKGEHVKIEAIKRAESQKGIVLRLYETAGLDATVTLEADNEWQSVSETDLMENPLKKIGKKGKSLVLSFGPFEIKTLLLG